MSKPSLARGTRDFLPKEIKQRNYLFQVIKTHFVKYGFEQIETPAIENLQTLTGKYGEEGDQLIFKILNSGDYLKNVDNVFLSQKNSKAIITSISEKALRYDLTVPTARYVVMNQNNLTFPFKRFQIQPVWRADRPQKGRYREFYQCDADIIGSASLYNEIDLIKLLDDVFTTLNLKTSIQINNRKILTGIVEVCNAEVFFMDIVIGIDKLDKVGIDGVVAEMLAKNISEEIIKNIKPVLLFKGNTEEQLIFLSNYLQNSKIGLNGIEEIKFIINQINILGLQTSNLTLDLTLARGLNYYTGAILEVKVNDERTDFNSSICGGGRYDDLTGVFGLKNMPGIGISFGADRIYDVLKELNLFPETNQENVKVMFVNFGNKEASACLKIIDSLRKNNIACELYPDNAKMGKQLKYASDKGIVYAALVGETEIQNNTLTLKNMLTGQQQEITVNDLLKILQL